MALRQAKIQPTVEEKRYITLQFLESAFMSGSAVSITPVNTYNLTDLSGETFTYLDKVNTFVIFDERPKVNLLKSLGWFREDAEVAPILAYIPTHLLYSKETDKVVNELLLDGTETQDLVKTGESANYELKELKITRGALVDIFYDFINENNNRFYVADVKVDLISINYIANLVPYKYDATKEGTEEQNPSNHSYIKFDSNKYGV